MSRYNGVSWNSQNSVVSVRGISLFENMLKIVVANKTRLQSVGDDASPIALTDSLYEKHCLNGAHILVRLVLPKCVQLHSHSLFLL